MRDGFIKTAAGTPEVWVADCAHNARACIDLIMQASELGVKVLCLPELCLTGYTCGDLFLQETLLRGAEEALAAVMAATRDIDMVVALGLPVRYRHKLFNCAAVVCRGALMGLVPKTSIPNYTEFYEARWFASARELGGGRAERLFQQEYRRMVLSPGACSAYAALVQTAADDGTHPLLFHCTAGKDRTGWGAALLLLLLGADVSAVRREYLAVGAAVRAQYEPFVRRFTERGGDPEIAAVLTEVRPAYLEAALDALTERWGDVERYAREALRVEAALDRLRAELTV